VLAFTVLMRTKGLDRTGLGSQVIPTIEYIVLWLLLAFLKEILATTVEGYTQVKDKLVGSSLPRVIALAARLLRD
jgi:hypothetical protein